jgi:hypothetical protein
MLLVRADHLGHGLALSTRSRLPVQHRFWCAGERRPSTERSSLFGVRAALGHADRVSQMPASVLGSRADREACWSNHRVLIGDGEVASRLCEISIGTVAFHGTREAANKCRKYRYLLISWPSRRLLWLVSGQIDRGGI